MATRSSIAAGFRGAAGDLGTHTPNEPARTEGALCEPARHLPSARTASGANNAVAIAPCAKIARIIPGGNLFERKATVSTWLPTVAMPYMLTKMAPASTQPCQRDLRIR